MTNEERDIITSFIERVSGARPAAAQTGPVPATLPALPPVDADADRHIQGLLDRYPEARYRLTQTAFVQEHALAESQNRIQQLQYELQQARQAQPAAAPAQPAQSRGFFGNLFGGGQPAQPQFGQAAYGQQQPQYGQQQYQPPPQPAYAPSYQPGLFQRAGGSGFLGSALTTAAGVAGGVVAGNALMNLFSEHHGSEGGFGGGGGSPWGGGGGGWDNQGSNPDQGQQSGGGWDNTVNQPDNSGFNTSNSGFDQADNSGWDTSGGSDSSDSGSSWDDSST